MTRPAEAVCFTIPGPPAGKKNSSRIIWPSISALNLCGAQGRVLGLKALFGELARRVAKNPAGAAGLLRRCEATVSPVIVPSADHEAWHKQALTSVSTVPGPRPLFSDDTLLAAETVFFLGKGQTGDLVNFEQAVWDLLQDAGLIVNDSRINSHGDSRLDWSDPFNPRVEVALWELGPRVRYVPPKVRVEGYAASCKELGPLRFSVYAPPKIGEPQLTLEGMQAPRGTSRDALVLEADRLWRRRHGERIPDGSLVCCGAVRPIALVL